MGVDITSGNNSKAVTNITPSSGAKSKALDLTKRYLLFIFSLFCTAMGIALARHSDLGVSPISSVANILSLKYTNISLGNWLIIWHCFLIAGQIILLRKNFQLIQLLQLPLSLLFGWFTDICVVIVSPIPTPVYPVRLAIIFVGILFTALGVSLGLIANVILNCGEAMVKAIADTFRLDFGYTKVGFDVFCVTTSVVLSLIFFDMPIHGTREGTVIIALTTGLVVKVYMKHIKTPVERLLKLQ